MPYHRKLGYGTGAWSTVNRTVSYDRLEKYDNGAFLNAPYPVLFFGGAPQSDLAVQAYDWLTTEIAQHIGPVLCVDGLQNTFANNVAVLGAGVAWTHATVDLACRSDAFFVLTASQGTGTFLAWIRQAAGGLIDKVVAHAGMLPAPDFEDIRANDRGGYKTTIQAAYTDNAGWQAARATHNPIQFAAADIAGHFPSKLWYCNDDPIALPSIALNYASIVGATTKDMGAHGHSVLPGGIQAAEIADYFGSQA